MKTRRMKDVPACKLERCFMKSEFFKFPQVFGKHVRHEDGSINTEKEVNLEELRGLLFWVYFMGVPSTVARSGKPG
jgi:hypothetical protein